MKRMLGILFIMLLATMVMAQTTTTYKRDAGNGHGLVIKTVTEAVHDTDWGDSIHTYTPSPTFAVEKVRFIYRDTANSKVDSVYAEYKNPNGIWVRTGMRNMLTGNVDAVLCPGDGNTVVYESIVAYGAAYRLRRYNVAYGSTHYKFYVAVETVSP